MSLPGVNRAADKRNDGQRKLLLDHYLASAPGPLGQAKSDLTKAEQALKALNDNLPTAMVMKEGPPRKAHILVRGQYDKKGEEVSPGFPTMLPPPPAGGKGLRRRIAPKPGSPTPAR